MNISVIGLGKLGACLLAHLATDHDVIGVDLNAKVVHDLNAGIAPYQEPQLQDLLTSNRSRYVATTDTYDVADTTITFIVVPTPSDKEGRFLNDHIFTAIDTLGAAIAVKKGPHVVVITSTVMPGATQGAIKRRLAKASGRSDIALAYSPEFIALGSVVEDLRNPDMILVGSEDGWVQKVVIDVLDPQGLVPTARLNTMEAEIAKLAINAFVTTKISFANTIGEICDHREVDANRITTAIGLDSRIGSKYLKSAGPFGGPCFPRDNQAFLAFAGDAPLARATIEVNERQIERTLNRIHQIAADLWGNVSVLGLAYKPDTPVIDHSFGVALVERLLETGYGPISLYDPLALDAVKEHWNGTNGVHYREHAQQCVDDSEIVVLAQPLQEFKALTFGERRVLDVWGIL